MPQNIKEVPPVPPFNVDNIPAELKNRRQWVCWKYYVCEGKTIKTPIVPRGEKLIKADVTDPNCLGRFEEAAEHARKHGLGIGFAFFKGAGIVGIDLDKLDQLGDEAREIMSKANTYMEYSPSGKGIHILGFGKLARAIKKAGVEIYAQDRFFTVTGKPVPGAPLQVNDIQALLDELVEKYGEKPTVNVEVKNFAAGDWEAHVNKLGYTLEEVRQRDKVLDEYLRGGLAGKPSPSEADMGTLERLMFWGYTPDEAVGILTHYRWRDKLLRRDYVEGMLQKLLPLKATALAHPGEKAQVLPHLNMIEDPDLAGKPVVVEAVVSSTSLAYLCPSHVEATFTDENGFEQTVSKKIRGWDVLNIQLVGVNELVKYRRLKRFLGLTKDANIRERAFRAVYRIRVRPPVFTLEKRGEKIVDERGFEYKSFDIYIVAEAPVNFQPSSLIRLEGIPVPNPKTQQTTLLAYKVEFPEEAYGFNIEKIKVIKGLFEGWTIKQRLNWILDNFERYSGIVGRRNLAEAGFLAYFTPTWIRLNGEIQKGWANVLFCGDTTTAKTETIRKLVSLLKGGMLVTGETATAVGLTGTATQVEREGWFIDWGFLVLLDRKLLAVDGAHKLSLANWAVLGEAERSGVVTIAKAAKNTAYARTRQIKIANPVNREADKYTTKSLRGFLYACQALPTILDKTSIARLDLAVFSNQHDVSPEEINKRQNRSPHEAIENLSEVLKWCWSGLAKLVFTDEAVDSIHANATSIYQTFFCEDIPIASIDMKWKLARLSAALAYLTLSTEDFEMVTVTKDHVELVADFIRQEYSKAGLNILAQTERYEALTLEDVQAFLAKIEATVKNTVDTAMMCEVLRYLVIHGRVTREELKAKFSLTEHNQLRPLLAAFTSEGLIKTGRGFYPEPKLIQAYKVSDGFDVDKVYKVDKVRKEPPNFKGEEQKNTPSYSDLVKVVNLVNISKPQREGTAGEWEGFHCVGPMMTPEKAYEKTVRVLASSPKETGSQILTKEKLLDLLGYFWTTESFNRVVEKLAADKVLKPLEDDGHLVLGCFLCGKLLPADLKNTTMLEGKYVHMECYLSWKKGPWHVGERRIEDVKTVYWSDEFFAEHECGICGYTKMTGWQAETFNGQQLWICEDCMLEWEKRQGA